MTKAEKEAGRWLKQAEEDLKYAKILFAAQGWYMVCFLAHQVVEKALKAFLYAQGEVRVIGHSVLKLLERTIKAEFALVAAGKTLKLVKRKLKRGVEESKPRNHLGL